MFDYTKINFLKKRGWKTYKTCPCCFNNLWQNPVTLFWSDIDEAYLIALKQKYKK